MESTSRKRAYLYTGLVGVVIIALIIVYFLVKGTVWEGHFFEWLNLVVRWMHITFGIAWIGASFYFVFLENALNRRADLRDELEGNLWAIHGGGFYYLEKYKLAPKKIPEDLHWFKYEAYFTWLTGFSLLFIVYYFHARSFLIDPGVMDLQPLAATAIGVGSLVVGWIIYDLLCKKLAGQGMLLPLIGFIIAVGFAWFYAHVFSGRAAYIHFGALLGTLMAANVFFVIIPSQKDVVRAAKRGELPDAHKARAAAMRSRHNNYLTLPVLFVMISNHFPGTFGNHYQWLVLVALSLASAGVKHYLNLKEEGRGSVWIMPVSIVLLLAVAVMTAPHPQKTLCKEQVSFLTVNTIVAKRCLPCHSSNPTNKMFTTAPNGIKFEKPSQIINLKDRIFQRVVASKTMPFNNLTNMTQKERDLIDCWIKQGAKP